MSEDAIEKSIDIQTRIEQRPQTRDLSQLSNPFLLLPLRLQAKLKELDDENTDLLDVDHCLRSYLYVHPDCAPLLLDYCRSLHKSHKSSNAATFLETFPTKPRARRISFESVNSASEEIEIEENAISAGKLRLASPSQDDGKEELDVKNLLDDPEIRALRDDLSRLRIQTLEQFN